MGLVGSLRATTGIDKACVPAYEQDPDQPDPCEGQRWSSAFPGKCIGDSLTDPTVCREDGTTKVTIHWYTYTLNECFICDRSVEKLDQQSVGQCTNYDKNNP
jgi:hypothetical protein